MENIDKYLKEFGNDSKFLLRYYLEDPERVLINYYTYGSNMSFDDKLELIYKVLGKVNINVLDLLTMDILVAEGADEVKIDELLNYLLKLDKDKIINIDGLLIKNRIYGLDPFYAVNKNIDNITCIDKVEDTKDLLSLLKFLKDNNYEFNYRNKLLLIFSILPYKESLIYFINNFNSTYVYKTVTDYIVNLSNKELSDLYKKITNDDIKEFIANKINFNNYNINNLINGEDIYLKTDKKEDKTLELLRKAKASNFNSKIILIMDRVNMNFINEAYKIYGKNLRISPIANQEEIRGMVGVWNMPYYTVNEIRKSEMVLDLYSSCVNDKIDKNGNIKRLSPLEKYIAAYIMTIKFSPYKSERGLNSYHKSRAIYEFVDKKTNKRIVCVGYVHLLREFLYRMGIKDTIDWEVHVPKENEYDESFINHLRMMIHLKDDKYNIDGVYMSDPTWDEDGLNSLKIKHMLMAYNELIDIDEDFSLENLKVDDLEKIKNELKVRKVDELFNKPISKDVIIKAFLALEHFLDLNMKMVNDNNYSKEEYEEMEEKLGFKRLI